MMKRILAYALCTALMLSCMSASNPAFANRETPLVRAVKTAKVSVVNIHSEKTTNNGDELFSSGRGRKKVNGMGTGIVVDERGYIVTNYHVVHGVDSLRVTLVDGGTYTATILTTDSKNDLAVIKIEPTSPLPVMAMGTSSDLMLGESVFAVGNAFGYEHTVTSGIVSALSRDVDVNETQSYYNLIQTDASINPGNSGGPLLNLDGEVIGINVAIRAGAQRIGFAIPIDDARRTIARLLSIEELNHHHHGLLAKDVKSGRDRKLVVELAQPDSPSARAGLQAGDVIVKTGTVDVVDAADFERALLGRSDGEAVDVVVERSGKQQTLSLKIEARHENAIAKNERKKPVRRQSMKVEKPDDDKAWRILGVRLAKVLTGSPILVGSGYRGGMKVMAVRQGSAADREGIRRDDVLVGLHKWETVSRENVLYVMNRPDFPVFGHRNPLKFYILRGSETLFGHLRPKILIGRK